MSRFEEQLKAKQAIIANKVQNAKSAFGYYSNPELMAVDANVLDQATNQSSAISSNALDSFSQTGSVPSSQFDAVIDTMPDIQNELLRRSGQPLTPKSPIVGKTKYGSRIHADGTYSFVDKYGNIHGSLTKDKADRMNVYFEQELKEDRAGVSKDIGIATLGGITENILEIEKSVIQGAGMGDSGTTFEEQVQARNNDITSRYKTTEGVEELKARTDDPRAQTLGKIMGETDQLIAERNKQQDEITPAKPLITPEQVEEYKRIKDTVDPATATPLFNELKSLDRAAKWNKMIYTRSEKVAAKLKSLFPGSHKDQMSAKAGYDAIAEDKGTWEGIKYTFANDLSTLLRTGIDSSPWMVAYTIGGPITQTSVLVTLARAKGLQGIEEFKTKYNRIPTPEEAQRIKLWKALGSVAEKYGDLSALKAFKGNVPVLNNIQKALAANTSTKVLALPSIAAIRISGALGGEAISGGITSAADQMAEFNKIVDPATIGYDMLAEAAGTPGGLATMATASIPFAIAEKRAADKVVNEETLISDIEKAEALLVTLTEKQKNKQKLTKRDVVDSNAEETINSELNQFTGYEAPLYTSEDEIPIDENGEYAPTTNTNFNKLFNHLLKEGGMKVTDETGTKQTGLEWKSALAETEQGMEIRRTEYTDALADLNRVVSNKDTRQLKRNLQAGISRLKQELEEKKFSNKERKKRIEDLQENVPPRTYKSKAQKAEDAEVEAAETQPEKQKIKNKRFSKKVDTGINEIENNTKLTNKQKADQLEEILNDADSKNLALTEKQRTRINKTLAKIAPVKSDETDTVETLKEKIKNIFGITPKEEENTLSSLQRTHNPEDLEKDTAEKSQEKDKFLDDVSKQEGLTKKDNEYLARIKKLRQYYNKLRSIPRSVKDMGQVNEESISGTAPGYLGFSTYRDEILKLLNSNRTASPDLQGRNNIALTNQLRGMKQHLANLQAKLAAFNKAKKQNKKLKKGKNKKFVVVEGTKKFPDDRTSREMEYTLKKVTATEYEELRDSNRFFNHIHEGSDSLLNKIKEEINYGTEAVYIAENHNKTSFFKNLELRENQISQDQVLADQILQIQERTENSVEDFTDADLEDLGDPTKSKSPGTAPAGFVSPEYANQAKSKEGVQALLDRLATIDIRILVLNKKSTALSNEEDIELGVLIEQKRNIQAALANTSIETSSTPTTPVAPSSEGREGATVQETTPPKVEEVVETEVEEETPELRQERIANETLSVEDESKTTTEGQESEGTTPVSETTPPVTEPSAPDTTQDGDTGQEGSTSKIPTSSRSKLAFRIVFPEIVTKEGLLVQDKELVTQYQEIFEELAEELGVAANYQAVFDALAELPESTDFLAENSEGQLRTLTETQLKKQASDSHEKDGKNSKSIASRIANRAERILDILGKKASDLISVRDEKNALNKIPGFVFDSGNKKYLIQAFKDAGITDASAEMLVRRWVNYRAKYEIIRVSEEEFIGPIYASSQPLNLLHLITSSSEEVEINGTKRFNHRLPNQILFISMLVNTNFIWQRKGTGTQPFMSGHQQDDFLYDGNSPVNSDEQQQLNALGFNYREAALQIGNQIAMASNLKSEFSDEYYDKLKLALGMQALQVDHGIFSKNNGDPKPRIGTDGKPVPDQTGIPIPNSELNSAEFKPDSPYQISMYTFNFKVPWRKGRKYNNKLDPKIAANLERTNNLPKGSINTRGEYQHIRINPNAGVWAQSFIDAIAEANSVLKLDLNEDSPNQSPINEVNTFIRNSLGVVSIEIIRVLQKKQKIVWSKSESMDIVGLLTNTGSSNRNVVESILGVDPAADDPNTNMEYRQSLQSSNRTTLANFNNTLRAFNNGTLKNFFVTYRLQNQLRYLMEGPVNPQQDKNVRFLVKSSDATEYSENNIHLFQLAVAYNFGVKIDKHNLPYAISQFKAILTDPAVLASVQLMNQINKLKDANPDITSEELNKDGLLNRFAASLQEVHSRDRYKDSNIALVGAITALSRYMSVSGSRDTKSPRPQQGLNKKLNSTFKSDIPLDIDGTSNGLAVNVLQFPNFQNTYSISELIEILERVGIYKGDET
jgi:hypothetical protein